MKLWMGLFLLLSLQVQGQNSITFRLGKENRMIMDTLLLAGTERFVLEIPPKSYGGSPLAWLNGIPVNTRLVKRQVNTLRPPSSWMELLLANEGKSVEIEVDEGKANLVSFSGVIMPTEKESSIVMLKTDNQSYEFIDINRIVHFNGPNLLADFTKTEHVGVLIEMPALVSPTPLTISILLNETSAKTHLVLDTTDEKFALSLQSQIKLPWVIPSPSSKFLELSLPSGIVKFQADTLGLRPGEQTIVFIPELEKDTTIVFWKLILKGQDPFKPNTSTDSYPELSLNYRYSLSNLLEDLTVIPRSFDWSVNNSSKGTLSLVRSKRSVYATEPFQNVVSIKKKFKWRGSKHELFEVSGYVLVRNTETDTVTLFLERKAVYDKANTAIAILDDEAPPLEWSLQEWVQIPPKSTKQVPYRYYLLVPSETR